MKGSRASLDPQMPDVLSQARKGDVAGTVGLRVRMDDGRTNEENSTL